MKNITVVDKKFNIKDKERKVFFTKNQIQEANRVSLMELAKKYGFILESTQHGKALHAKQSGGLYIFPANNRFHCFTDDISGGAIDFLMHYENLEFTEAVASLLNTENIVYEEHVQSYQPEKKGILVLPEKADNYKRVYWYLVSKRGIDPEIVSKLMNEKKIYQQKDHGNCVFVGYDEKNNSRYCAVRGTYDKEGKSFRMDVANSDKAYPFVMEGKSDTVFVCEAPIDAMSHASLSKINGLDWKVDSRISLGCLSDNALETYLKTHANISKIIFCLDNDYNSTLQNCSPAPNYGQEAAAKHYQKYSELGYCVGIQTPHLKDFNQDLVETRNGCKDLDALREERIAADNIVMEKTERKRASNLDFEQARTVVEKGNTQLEELEYQEDGWEEVEDGFEI